LTPDTFFSFQTRQQQGDQSQEDFIGKRDEIGDDQVGDEEAQGKRQEFGVAKPGDILQEKVSKHVSLNFPFIRAPIKAVKGEG